MGVRFLDDAATAAFDRAIKTIETASAAEVVVALRRRSGDYRQANAIVALGFAFIALAVALYAETEFTLAAILGGPMVLAILGYWLPELVAPIKRVLTSPSARRAHVLRAARATFVERGVHNTTGRSGLLVYIAYLERDVALIADSALAQALPADALARIEAAMVDAFGKGGVAVAERLAELAPHCARAMPHHADDVNELPDAIHSDLERP